MAQTLESVKGGGGSTRIGTTGTIGSLVTRELESLETVPSKPIPPKRKTRTTSVSVPCGGSTVKILQPRRNPPFSANAASSSHNNGTPGSSSNGVGNPRDVQKTKSNIQKNIHSIPMLSSDGFRTPTERTPNREKAERKAINIVEVVDLKCGHPDKAWSSPITSRLKKLGFSKLSETIN